MPESWLAGMAISLRDLEPIEENELCIQPVGGLLEVNKGPDPERINDTAPSCWKPRSIWDPTGLFTDDNASWY
jgi:hypothetical protein